MQRSSARAGAAVSGVEFSIKASARLRAIGEDEYKLGFLAALCGVSQQRLDSICARPTPAGRAHACRAQGRAMAKEERELVFGIVLEHMHGRMRHAEAEFAKLALGGLRARVGAPHYAGCSTPTPDALMPVRLARGRMATAALGESRALARGPAHVVVCLRLASHLFVHAEDTIGGLVAALLAPPAAAAAAQAKSTLRRWQSESLAAHGLRAVLDLVLSALSAGDVRALRVGLPIAGGPEHQAIAHALEAGSGAGLRVLNLSVHRGEWPLPPGRARERLREREALALLETLARVRPAALHALNFAGSSWVAPLSSALAAALGACPALEWAHLGRCELGAEGARAVLRATSARSGAPVRTLFGRNDSAARRCWRYDLSSPGEAVLLTAELRRLPACVQAVSLSEAPTRRTSCLAGVRAELLDAALARTPPLHTLALGQTSLSVCEAVELASRRARSGRPLRLCSVLPARDVCTQPRAHSVQGRFVLLLHDLALGVPRAEQPRTLDAANGTLADASAPLLVRAVAATPALQELNLLGNRLSLEAARGLARELRELRPTQLGRGLRALCGGAIGASHGVVALTDVARDDVVFISHDLARIRGQVRQLALRNGSIDDAGACELLGAFGGGGECARALPLTHLDLSMNLIGREGAKALAQCVRACPALRVLRVAHNLIDGVGMLAIAEAVAARCASAAGAGEPELELELDVRGNLAGDDDSSEGAAAAEQAWQLLGALSSSTYVLVSCEQRVGVRERAG